MIIKSITLWQPWASLIALGLKQYETRSWPTSYRGWLAIHAAKRKPNMEELTELMTNGRLWHSFPWDSLPLGCIVAVAKLTVCHRTEDVVISARERRYGDWTPGRFAWELRDVVRLETPIPARGSQGLWTWEVPAEIELPGVEAK